MLCTMEGCRNTLAIILIGIASNCTAEVLPRPVRIAEQSATTTGPQEEQEQLAADGSSTLTSENADTPPAADVSGTADPAAGDAGDDLLSGDDELDALLDQDLSSLRRTSVAPALDVEVSTVSRQESTIGRSPAAVYVVNDEMIRRSGARTLPDVLRLVPGLHVANIDGSKWSISSRGFPDRFANKLLVQIDGRTVYTHLFGGVLWDINDLLLDDIKRIEVIRGPGAAIWGANAVNGVINIITKSASETQGVYAHGGGGDVQRAFTGARVGGRAHGVDYRVSGKWYDRDTFFDPTGRADDSSQQGRVGFRTDWKNQSCDQMTFQGDWYQGKNNLTFDRPIFGLSREQEDVSGGNVLGRWTRVLSDTSDMSLQFYYDRTDRVSSGFDQDINTIDIDFQHRFSPLRYHQLIWGLGYRNIWDRLENKQTPAFISTDPVRRTLERVSAFVQDEMTLLEDKLYLTIGTKLSHNTYTQFEVQPSIRTLWLPTESSAVWGAVSRAVRVPTRATEDIVLLGPPLPSPPFPPNTPTLVLGNRNMVSEELIAYELGMRQQVNPYFSWDLACFYNVYEDLLTTQTVFPPAAFPYVNFFNGSSADVYGLEISTQMQMTCDWKMTAWYSYLRTKSRYAPDALETPAETDGGAPINQAFLMSTWNPHRNVDVDIITRYVDRIRFDQIPSYIAMDVRMAWRPTSALELAVVGQNLLDSSHPEFAASTYTVEVPTEVPRGVYGMATLRY